MLRASWTLILLLSTPSQCLLFTLFHKEEAEAWGGCEVVIWISNSDLSNSKMPSFLLFQAAISISREKWALRGPSSIYPVVFALLLTSCAMIWSKWCNPSSSVLSLWNEHAGLDDFEVVSSSNTWDSFEVLLRSKMTVILWAMFSLNTRYTRGQ